MAVLIERLSRLARPRERPQVGRFRRYDEARPGLELGSAYYLARGSRGPTLIPYDDFLEEVERTLWLCTNPGDEGV